MNKFLFISITAIYLLLSGCQSKNDYKNAKLPIEKRVEALLSQMTVEEKVAQMYTSNVHGAFLNDKQELDEAKFIDAFKNGVGGISFDQVNMPLENAVKVNNAIQKLLKEKTRLGIPSFFIGEGLHGFMANGSTVYPQAIALAGTWDTTLIEKVFSSVALEMRARGYHQALSPVLDLSRDPRWGRTEETYSEDTYLSARIGKAAIIGFQGRNAELDSNHVIATLKHFAGHGQGEGGNNLAPVMCDERYFRENHLYPFEIAVKEAKAQSLMPSYNEWSSIPNHSNTWLLKTVLRDEWHFNGYIISDQGGIDDLLKKHFVAKDTSEAVALAMNAGVEFEIADTKSLYSKLVAYVKKGIVSEKLIDDAVRRVLTMKFKLGMFENSFVDIEKSKKTTNCVEHKQLALQAAQEAIVLLKNANNLLPLDSTKIKNLAVIGSNAAEIHLGGYTFEPRSGISVLDGMKQFANGKFNVQYAEGCKISTKSGTWGGNENPVLNDPANDEKLISEAVAVARNCDAVLLVLGENESICREAWSEDHRGDRDNLDLIGKQEDLVREILKTGKPVIVLLINGRPITINYVAQNVPAILEGWYLGQETGTAVANIVFGKAVPSGKLSITIPKNIGQMPFYYSKKPSRMRNYLFTDMNPLYPFGFGLSYTTFEYSKPEIAKNEISKTENVKVSVNVKNTGKYKADEIVQLYIHDKIASVTRPIMELKDFVRITLNPSESKTVEFTITPEKLQFYNSEMKRVVEAGDFEVLIGPNSQNLQKVEFTVK